MSRRALASAAEARGWLVSRYDAKSVFGAARQTLRVESLDAYFLQVRRAVWPPCDKDHKPAMAAGHGHDDRGCVESCAKSCISLHFGQLYLIE
jgi:hypothetical protein